MTKRLLIISCLLISLSSCVKIRQCECTTTKDGQVIERDVTEFPGTKKLTNQMCEDHEDDLNEIKFDPEESIECKQK